MKCKNCGKKVYVKEVCQCGEKAPKMNGPLVFLNSFICSFVLFLSVFTLIVSVSLRYIVNNGLLTDAINDIDFAKVEITIDGEQVKLDQYIYDKYIDDDRITVENVDNVLHEPSIKKFLTKKINGYQKFLLDEGDIELFTSDDVIDLIDDHEELIERETGLRFLPQDKQELKENLKGLDKFSDFCEEQLTGWFNGGFIKSFFSLAFVIFLSVLCAAILVQWLLVYKFNGRRMMRALKRFSIALFVPSVIILIPSAVCKLVDNYNFNSIESIFTPFLICSAIFTGTAIILFIVSIIFGGKKNKYPEMAAIPDIQNNVPVMPEAAPADTGFNDQPFNLQELPEANTDKPANISGSTNSGSWNPENIWSQQSAQNDISSNASAFGPKPQENKDNIKTIEAAQKEKLENLSAQTQIADSPSQTSEQTINISPIMMPSPEPAKTVKIEAGPAASEKADKTDTEPETAAEKSENPKNSDRSLIKPVTLSEMTSEAAAPSAAAEPEKEFVFCTKCGNKNRSQSKFCTKCGNTLRS